MVSPVRLFLRGLHHFLLADMRQSLDSCAGHSDDGKHNSRQNTADMGNIIIDGMRFLCDIAPMLLGNVRNQGIRCCRKLRRCVMCPAIELCFIDSAADGQAGLFFIDIMHEQAMPINIIIVREAEDR